MSFDVLSEVNYLAALVAAIAYFAIGAVWYSPLLFSRAWQRSIGRDPGAAMTPGAMLFVITGIAYFVQAVTLGAIARTIGTTELVDGLVLGIFTGVGIVAVQLWVNASYEQRPPALVWINGGVAVLGFIAMAIIMTVWD